MWSLLRIWGRVGAVDKCWHMSLRSLLACVTIWGFRPSPFFVCVLRGGMARFLCFLLGGVWVQEAAARWFVVCGGRVL